MKRAFLGVKKVTAWPNKVDGRPGYTIESEDGDYLWSPKEVFERMFFPLGDILGRSIAPEDVEAFIGLVTAAQIDPKTALVKSEGPTGFLDYESVWCLEPTMFDLRTSLAVGGNRIKERLWSHLEFVLLWALNGLASIDGQNKVRRCRVCGCTDDHACEGGCYWVEPDLCSACVKTARDEGPLVLTPEKLISIAESATAKQNTCADMDQKLVWQRLAKAACDARDTQAGTLP